MKRIHRVFIAGLLAVGLLLAGRVVVAQGEFYTASGTVKDKVTRKPLEYAGISVLKGNTGTVSNADGYFSLKIPAAVDAQFVEVSHVGYYSVLIPVKGENIDLAEVLLTPYANPLNEVVIRGWDAYYLMREAVSKIEDNYAPAPGTLTGFYRETVQKRRNYINISEAVIDMYKTAYNEGVDRDRVRILKGRRLLSTKASDTLAVKLLGGPNLSIFVDIVKNPDVLLDKETLWFFGFKMEDVTQINGRDQYVITFRPQVVRDFPLYFGTFYIDKESLAFTRAEFRLDMADRNKVSDIILKKKPAGLRFRPEELSYVVAYRERNGRSYLNYIRNEIRFKCDRRRRLFSANYAVVSEMAVTDLAGDDGGSVAGISRKEAFSSDLSLSDRIGDFSDDDFWGAYNIIEPTESLESAVARLKKKQE